MKKIPMANPSVGVQEARAVFDVLKNGWISMGKVVLSLEKKIEKYLKVKNAILFNNGTSSLHACLLAYDIKNGDEVIVPTLNYISAANAVIYCGAKPIFCESDPNTYNVTPESLESKITYKTKAIITVDLKGMPVDYDSINKKIKKYNIPLISDSAESFGAEYKKKKVGRQFDLHSFSFFANKNITMGEGGLITCNSDMLAKKIRIIRNQGQNRRYNHTVIGNNFRPTDYAAAIGIEQLKKVDKILFSKNQISKSYDKAFSKFPNVSTPFVPNYVSVHSWYMYSLKFKNSFISNKFKNFLLKKKIDYRVSFPPIHLQPIYKKKFGFKKNSFPISEKIANTFVDLPCWSGMTNKQVNYIINQVSFFLRNNK
jgi:perosamine synthetase